jgi:tellurite resistance protein TerC
MVRRIIISTLKQARRLVVIVIGFTVLVIGLALIVLPGPAFLVIPFGLAILATEFLWARRLLRHVKDKAGQMASRVSGNWTSKPAGSDGNPTPDQENKSP